MHGRLPARLHPSPLFSAAYPGIGTGSPELGLTKIKEVKTLRNPRFPKAIRPRLAYEFPASRLRRDKRAQLAPPSTTDFATGFIAAGIIGIIGVLVIQLVFASVAPTMLNQTQSLEINADLTAANQALVAVFDTLLVVSYVLVPLAIIFLVLGLALFVMQKK